jgi:hypothetical protein
MRRLARLCEGMTEGGWLTALILVPLFFDRGSSEVFDAAKAGLLGSIALVTVAAWAASLVLGGRARAPEAAPWWRLPLVKPIAALVGRCCRVKVFGATGRAGKARTRCWRTLRCLLPWLEICGRARSWNGC